METLRMVTVVAPVNIAVIKYWGKRDENLILPLNGSISGTLSTNQMCAKTTVSFSRNFTRNRIWLNGVEETFENRRLINCLNEVRRRAKEQGKISPEELEYNVHICSVNNFPTAAGLASSAAGYACLVASLSKLYQLDGDISSIARQGSGSACRSIYGGFVEWIAGDKNDGTDSCAVQVVDSNHWNEMRVLILVVSENKKKTGSTAGMQTSVATSELLKTRVSQVVPKRLADIKQAIYNKDFKTFADITMQDSNQFHAVCLDTYPPLVYMSEVSHAISDLIHQINEEAGKTIVAYTFDAGPNACLYLLEEHVPLVLAAVNHVFPTTQNADTYFTGIPVTLDSQLEKKLPKIVERTPWDPNALRYTVHTKIGEGPKELTAADHLLGANGHPTPMAF
ncbi:unnamed protein product [Allacma fusca]|uniref:Diphosphomevalonate decarboxylase n=1 Tax=Allacma fusca TaxID=39272 RepID=A0A8J2JFY7_9HEXA|nr:unnamed protein product [Allacma fusca]